jgi:hypothetical protein
VTARGGLIMCSSIFLYTNAIKTCPIQIYLCQDLLQMEQGPQLVELEKRLGMLLVVFLDQN